MVPVSVQCHGRPQLAPSVTTAVTRGAEVDISWLILLSGGTHYRMDLKGFESVSTYHSQTNALGVTNFPWGQTVQRSANECWFFALVASVFLSLYDLAFLNSQRQERSVDRPEDQGKSNSNVTINKDDTQKKKQKNRILTQLTIDAADLFIPGAAVGWIPVSALVVGSASLISTTLAGQQIWTKVQAPRDPSTKVKT